jgi:hypothetical protein
MCLAVSVAVPLWGVVPGQASWTAAAPVFGSLPVILINTLIARHLALGLFDRDQGLERDTALATLGSRLIGVTDRKQVIAASWVTAEAICRATVEDSLRSPHAATAACAATRTRTGLAP